jgi:signal transduction histidine kinase
MQHGGNEERSSAVIAGVAELEQAGGSRSTAELSARAAQRLSVLGEMTGGIAHDFRNILAVVDSGLRLAESNSNDPGKVRAFISGAREGVERGLRLTSQLLAFARQGEVQARAADANALLGTLELLLKYGAGPSVRIVLECSPTLPKCLVDPSQFATAILNLVVNARDAMPDGGEIRIHTSRFEAKLAASEPGLRGTYVRVRVQDNGSGMPDDVVCRVFEPFFTTKGEKGTGLGIPQVRAFMQRVGGHIDVTSEQGCGTTVDLFFPAIEPENSLPHTNSSGVLGSRFPLCGPSRLEGC